MRNSLIPRASATSNLRAAGSAQSETKKGLLHTKFVPKAQSSPPIRMSTEETAADIEEESLRKNGDFLSAEYLRIERLRRLLIP